MNKSHLEHIVKQKISDKVAHIEYLIAEIRASNSETKSSMGNKYETGREMLQQEINQLQRQLSEAVNQQNSIRRLMDSANLTADFGAVVETSTGCFYIATPVGEILFEDKKIVTISPQSPLAKAMHGKKEGETFTLNQLSPVILKIW